MTAFGGLGFFFILAAAMLPAMVLGLCGKRLKYYGMAVNLLFVALFFNTPAKALLIAGFFLLQTALTQGLLRLKQKGKSTAPVLAVFVILSCAPLLFGKVNALLPHPVGWIGVSYMTFRAVQVLIEIHDGLIRELNILDFYYFLLFFPSIGTGPIDRFRRFQGDMDRVYSREEYLSLLREGVFQLFTGALYNFVLAAAVNLYWLEKCPETFLGNWAYMYGYIFFLFFNFAGISRMAQGAANLLGIRTPSNFNMPFLSHDLKDFWSRWHISLSTWFRDFLYTRFVMDSMRKKRFKSKYTASYIGYFLTMMTMGLWHGLAPRYIVYGAFHGGLMCLNDVLDNHWKGFKRMKREDKWQPVLIFVTFHVVSFGLLIFSGRLF